MCSRVLVSSLDRKATDYRLYSTVEIAGNDPNRVGLIGYDNTPVKMWGIVAYMTRRRTRRTEDGFPGYGGVFLQSFLHFHSTLQVAYRPIPAR